MATADKVFIGAGMIAFAGSFKDAGGFPENGYAIVGGTAALAFLSSFTNGTSLQKPITMLAVLTLLASIYVYVPGIAKQQTRKKVKKHG